VLSFSAEFLCFTEFSDCFNGISIGCPNKLSGTNCHWNYYPQKPIPIHGSKPPRDVISISALQLCPIHVTANESTACPVNVERVVFDSKADARLSYPFHPNWSAAELTGRRLTVNGHKPFPSQIQDGKIVVDIPARVPVTVYAREDAIATPAATQST
jgi:hypothetical protein